jgi:hypothetical protein
MAAESQLAVEVKSSEGGSRRRCWFSSAFRILWGVLSKLLDGWEEPGALDEAGNDKALAHDSLPSAVALALPSGAPSAVL